MLDIVVLADENSQSVLHFLGDLPDVVHFLLKLLTLLSQYCIVDFLQVELVLPVGPAAVRAGSPDGGSELAALQPVYQFAPLLLLPSNQQLLGLFLVAHLVDELGKLLHNREGT